jgi:DNA replication protein DnaC
MKKTAEIVQDGRVLQGRGALLYGMVGTGKTHCAVSMLREVLKVSTYNCTFERSADIISKIIKYEGKDTYIQEVMAYDVIILDDLGKMYMQNEWVKERAFTLLDSIVSSEKVLIATTNLESLRELDDKFGMAISSRIIGQCEMIKFEGTDYRKLKVTRELRKQKEGQHELERK